jgi:hypothetical protein
MIGVVYNNNIRTMGDDKKNKPLQSPTREEIQRQFPNLKIVDETDKMIGKTTLFTWYRKPRDQQHRKDSPEEQTT